MKVRKGPDGLHLFDRLSGVNVLFDECKIGPESWSPAPRQVSIALTNLCDLQCSYCYAPKSRAMLELPLIERWLEELDVAGCLGVGFGGGEPTLHPAFADICRSAAKNTKLAVTFTSHGHRLVPQLLEQLAGSVHFVRISVDGVGSTYESLRGRSFQALKKRLKDIRQISPIGINVVVNKDTINDLDAVAELAEEVEASELLLLPQQATLSVSAIDTTVAGKLQQWVGNARPNVRLAISELGAYGMQTCNPLPLERGLRSYAHIDATGRLRASSYSTDGYALGDQKVISVVDQLRAMMGEIN